MWRRRSRLPRSHSCDRAGLSPATSRRPMQKKKPDIDRIFHALGDPSRRAILEKLSEGPISVSRLAEPLDITLAAVVQHLQVLEESGLVQTEKIGRVRTCRIDSAGLSAAQRWIGERRSLWERGLDRLGEFLAEQEEKGE
jgi:DNA-binding transcriptional ArsR family regulator